MPFEVQIRTWEMHHTAEYGIAAHWKYKEGKVGKVADEEKFAWVRRLLESQQDSDTQEFMQALKVDMFADEVFVFTPRGDVVNLPAGSTPIDFAYSIHSEVGNRMTGAMVNGRMVPYSHVLANGDIVKILTSNSAKGPGRDWLDMIKSPEARNKIRQWFKRERRDENIIHGKMAFESALRHASIPLAETMTSDIIRTILSRTSFESVDELFAAIGYGGISAAKIVNKIREELRFASKTKKSDETIPPQNSVKTVIEKRKPQGIIVEGLDNCLFKFARCCLPVPGDPIVGFITRGFGVSVHRQDCQNYIKSLTEPESEKGRWVRTSWGVVDGIFYSTTIEVTVHERSGIVADVASILNVLNLKIISFNARVISNDMTHIAITVDINNRDELISAMAKIMAISGVTDVSRPGG
ncbi:MAG: TGS domain-containing protein [Oscillospiraceae bacterium]|nr:TGS domain-containing protein [Oscillospiraceae bacterium]